MLKEEQTRNHRQMILDELDPVYEEMNRIKESVQARTNEFKAQIKQDEKEFENRLEIIAGVAKVTPETAKKILDNTHNGAIILLHPTSSTNAKILRTVIHKWRDMGYSFGTLDELTK